MEKYQLNKQNENQNFTITLIDQIDFVKLNIKPIIKYLIEKEYNFLKVIEKMIIEKK